MKIVKIIKKELPIMAVSLFVGVLIALAATAYTYVYSATTQQNIADNVIRFHVLANSDSVEDQALKERVRMGVLAEFEEALAGAMDIENSRAILTSALPDMQTLAEEIITREGFGYQVYAQIANVFFPTRAYGSMTFPPGEYEAVQLVIGSGSGSNWWCLMFPPLCFVDMTATEEGRQQLADTVTEEGFRLLTHMEAEDPSLTVRFRVVEWWQYRGQPNAVHRYEQVASH